MHRNLLMMYKSMYGTLIFCTQFNLDNTCSTGMIALNKKNDLAQDVYDLQTMEEAYIKHAMASVLLL